MIKELLQNKLPHKRSNLLSGGTFSPKYLRICCSPYENEINNLFKHIKPSSHKKTTTSNINITNNINTNTNTNNNNVITANMKPLSSSVPKDRNTQLPGASDDDNNNANTNTNNNNNNNASTSINNNNTHTNNINNTHTKQPLSTARSHTNRSCSSSDHNKPSLHDKETQTSHLQNLNNNNTNNTNITHSNSNANISKTNSPPLSATAVPNNNNTSNSSLSTKPKPNDIQTNPLTNLNPNIISPLLSQTKLRKSNSSLSSPYLTNNNNTNQHHSATPSSPFTSTKSRKLRNKYQHQYITSLSNEHCNNIQSLHYATQTASKQAAQNIKTLQTWLTQIKQNGFDKQEAKIKEKELLRSKLTHSVKLIHAKINANTKSYKNANGSKSKYTFENKINQSKIEKHKKESFAFLKEIDALKEEIPMYTPQIEKLKNETTEINEDIMKVSYDVSNMKNHIKEINKMIASVCKEKDGARSELNVVKKQIKLIRTKVNEMYNKNANFMLNVNQLIEDNQLENTLNI